MDEARFDWGAIARASAIIVGVVTAFALIVPVAGALAVGPWDTLKISGSEIYNWAYWAIAWALTIWQGAWMIRRVHERIIDDMLVTSVIAAIALIVVKFVVWILYEPVNEEGQRLFAVTAIDAGGALMLIVVALIGARINRY
ncbi:MAG TPA: hypothetical protein ENI95_15255 [Chloroflexi bacterium]|nr:hypothetical protein [Chloroflexota bacterium]